ncbi:TBC1 domain family member 22B [Nilaparvata lugens]|uniref:TBC1 domain family member 22B n=1 Tax=Nilaparvata lugens TaxID=108931 RepID=UPI00193D1B0B|nr:TBC1 domain family member 22B [Nilaparvata lugens]
MNENDNVDQSDLKGGTFWKKHTKAVPGRPSPQKEVKNVAHHNSAPASSFKDFQESVRDAWEIEDDDEFGVADVKISKQVAKSAALSVLNSHRNQGGAKPGEKAGASATNSKSARGQPQIHVKPVLLPPIQPSSTRTVSTSESNQGKVAKFQTLIDSPLLNLDELRQLSWSGVPVEIRPNTWRLLAGYLPASLERRLQALERKRLDYWNLVNQYYDIKERDETHQDTYRQIHIDIPRMSPLIALFQQKAVQEMFERILFIWAIRHPASGYVQGINDLVTPFFIVFLQEVLSPGDNMDSIEISSLVEEKVKSIEADTFWCLSKFLDGIQDNYIFAQLGIQQKVNQLKDLIQRIDGSLHKHLQKHDIDYLQFSFRWMNNLLTRELPLRCSIRLWDTYLAEADSYASLHKYVCAAFLLNWRQQLLNEKDFQGLMLLLQNLPTQHWTDSDIGMLVAEAYRLKFTFADAPNHLQTGEIS